MTAPALAVLDVGNTAVKAVIFDRRGRVLRASRGEFPALPAGCPVLAVSVNGARLARVESALAPRRILLLGRDVPLRARNGTSRPRETGHDRLCAAAAAHHRAGGAAVALGLGTAVTADAVDDAGRFLGGSIGPGLRAAAAGLAAAAPGLPAVDLRPRGPVPVPGRSTRAALRAGFLLGFAGLAERLAGEAARAARRGGGVPVYLHGGDADAVGRHLALPVRPAPHLVAEGARLLWLRAGGGASR